MVSLMGFIDITLCNKMIDHVDSGFNYAAATGVKFVKRLFMSVLQ